MHPASRHATPRTPAKSPCINVCTLDAQRRFCRGCLRTLAEITAWSEASDAERWRILAAVAERRTLEGDGNDA